MTTHAFAPAFALALAGLATAQEKPGERPRWSDQEVRKFVYGPTRWPKGFGQDPLFADGFAIYYHRAHWSSEDGAQARRWIEEHLARSSIPAADKIIRKTKKNQRGIDFLAGRMWFRVHRPSYFQWSQHWLSFDSRLDGKGTPRVLGTLRVRPVTKEAVRILAEYDWRIRYFNAGDMRVLASESKETDTHVFQILETTSLSGGDWDLPDKISRWRYVYAVDKKTGQTKKSRHLLRTLKGHENKTPHAKKKN